MAFLPALAATIVGGVLVKKAVKAVVGGGSSKAQVQAQPGALPVARRDDAADAIAREDELRRRKGAAADILNGVTGAEAALSTPGKFVPGS